MNIHDKLFKATFSQAEHAGGIIRRNLPPEIVGRIDFATLTLCTGSFVDELLKERYTDLLFSAKIGGSSALIYLLHEHQSSVEPLMALRLLRYMVRIWDAFVAEHSNVKRLPAIVAIVVHHSQTGWTAATELHQLFDIDAEALAALGDRVPRLRFVLDDISAESDEALRQRAMSALGRLVLLCLKNARNPQELLRNLSGWVDLVREVRRAPDGVAALMRVWRYILAACERLEKEQVLQQLAAAAEDEGKEEIVNVADQLREEGRDEGREQGLAQGQRKTLLRLLGIRFGTLPASVVTRLQAASPALLDEWTDRVLTAPSLAEVLGEP